MFLFLYPFSGTGGLQGPGSPFAEGLHCSPLPPGGLGGGLLAALAGCFGPGGPPAPSQYASLAKPRLVHNIVKETGESQFPWSGRIVGRAGCRTCRRRQFSWTPGPPNRGRSGVQRQLTFFGKGSLR